MTCVLCKVAESNSRHHMIPKCQKNADNVTEGCCRPCHDMVHATITNRELGRKYNTVEKLRAHPQIAAWIRWRQTHPDALPKIRQSKSKYRRSIPVDNRMDVLLAGVPVG